MDKIFALAQGELIQRTVEITVDPWLSLRSEKIFLSVFQSLKEITLLFHQEEMEEHARAEKPGHSSSLPLLI